MGDPRIAAVEGNLLEQFRVVAASGLVTCVPADDVVAYHRDIAFPLFNAISGATFGDDEARAAQIVDDFCARGLPYLWWTTPSTYSPAIDRALREAGAMCEPTPGMHAVLDHERDAHLGDRIVVEPVTDVTMPVFLGVLEGGFGFPPYVVGEFGKVMDTVDPAQLRHVLAYVDGTPAGAGTLFVTGGTGGIYNVATMSSARGRGVGYAVTASLMNSARAEGCTDAILHASEAGLRLYERLGFSQVCTVPQYVWMP